MFPVLVPIHASSARRTDIVDWQALAETEGGRALGLRRTRSGTG